MGAAVTVADYSFEGNSLTAGNYSNNLGPEWLETSGPNNGNGFEEYITGFAAQGTDHLGMALGHDVWQNLAVTYQANTRYTLTVAAGNRGGLTESGNQTQYLLADTTGAIYATGIYNASVLPADTFGNAPALVFDTPGNPASVGKTVRILLRARGSGRSHFDNIRLDATSLIPPGAAAIENDEAASVQSGAATLHGTVLDIGTAAPAITFYWGTSDGGATTNWANSATLPGTFTGGYALPVTGLNPTTLYFFTSRAVNGSGTSWAFDSGSFTTLPLVPAVTNLPAAAVRAVQAELGADVTSTGGELPQVTIHLGTVDGGTVTNNWQQALAMGAFSGSATILATNLTSGTTYYYRARATNSGGTGWAPESGQFTTETVQAADIETRDADGITGTTATLRGDVTDDGNDSPVCTLFYGTADAGTNAATWQVSVPLGVHDGNLSRFVTGLLPQTVYFFRLRAVNAGGVSWSTPTATFTTTPLVPQTAVINEIHYKPLDDTSLEEFIELRNPGDTALDLSGWSFTSGISYTFPAATTLPAGGYLVVAQDPAVILSKFGRTALGPWTGGLSSKGETIELRDAGGALRDRVTYGVGFPWPTAPDGAGNSAELLSPILDNDLGGSWRSSGAVGTFAQTFITPAATGWRYKKGTAEASTPVDAWRAIAYNDSTWLSGQTPIGYGTTVACNTVLSDMLASGGGSLNYRTVYGRKTFTVPVEAIPDTLTLKVRVDDGCVVWINGTEVYRVRVNTGQRPYNDSATSSITTATWTTITLTGTSAYLFGGSNVLAIHGINRNSTNGRPDFSFDVELGSPASGGNSSPTPGAVNNSTLPPALVPPQIRQVDHSPKSPASAQPVTITARITDPDGMGAVSLAYQTVDAGAYIRLTDSAYSTSWTSVPMVDNGTAGDAISGDSIFTAVLPANIQVNRRLVRYRVTFADALGNSATVPYADDEQPNFAYYVYDGLPAWQGSLRPGTTSIDTFPATVLDDIPVYSLVANGTDVINSQYSSGSDADRFRGTFVYNGEVYDHIQFRNRGEGSTYVSGKNKWRFFFNRARDLSAKDNFNTSYSETWGSFSGDACASPWAALHRGMAGVEEATSYKIFQLAGLPSPSTHYYHFRVVRGATETPAAGTTISDPIGTTDGQYCGDFWGLYLAVEQPDGSFLDERGLPDGNVYKIEGNAGDKKHQAPGQPADSSDWNTFRDGHINSTATESWWRANMDLEAYYTFHALNRLIGNVDVRGGYNHYFYHRSSDNRWLPLPWDLDMMFIAKHHWTTSIGGTSYPGVIDAHRCILQQPALALEYRNRAREILDLLASDATPGGGQAGQLIDELAQIVNPSGVPFTWADADAAMWNLHPRTQGTDGNHGGETSHKGNFFWTSYADSRIGGGWTRWLRNTTYTGVAAHEDCMVYLRDYATDAWPGGAWAPSNGDQLGYGYQYLAYEAADTAIPNRPVLTHTGPSGFPANALTFASSAFSDPQGAGTYAAHQWRVSEIAGPGIPGFAAGTRRKYEIENAWTSGVLPTAPGSFSVPLQVVEVGKTYRVRVRHKDATGRWSRWSLPVQFQPSPPPLVLLHYWNFNTPATQLLPTQTIGGGTLTPVLAGAAAVVSDTGQSFAGLNARNGDTTGAHLRLNNPVPARLDLALPTTGFTNIVVRYETRRSGQGAGTQVVQYTLNGSAYTEFTRIAPVDGTPTLQTLDFRALPAVNNNPLFGLSILFEQGPGGTAGNNRFDNLTVEADPLPGPARLLPVGPAAWGFGSNWSSGFVPDAPGVTAIIGAPAAASRTVTLGQPVTLGTLAFEQGGGAATNLLAGANITFDGNGVPALVSVSGGGGGHAALTQSSVLATETDFRTTASNDLLTLAGALTGAGRLVKSGPGMLALTADSSTYAGPVIATNGVLRVNGVLTAPVQIASGAALEGHGFTGVLSCAGAVRLGATVLTAPSSSAATLAFVLGAKGLPAAEVAASSSNSVLRLTAAAALPAPPSVVQLFIDAAPLLPGDRLAGGLFTPVSTDLAAALASASVQMFVRDPAGTTFHRGVAYRAALPADLLTWSVLTTSLDFGGGAVAGRTLEVLKGGVPTGYPQWRSLWFANPADRANDAVSGPYAHPAGDGSPNILRYALGVGALDPVTGLLPHLQGPGPVWAYRFRYNPDKADLIWTVLASPNLVTWPAPLFDSRTDTPPPLVGGWLSIPLPASLSGFPAPIQRMYISLQLELE